MPERQLIKTKRETGQNKLEAIVQYMKLTLAGSRIIRYLVQGTKAPGTQFETPALAISYHSSRVDIWEPAPVGMTL